MSLFPLTNDFIGTIQIRPRLPPYLKWERVHLEDEFRISFRRAIRLLLKCRQLFALKKEPPGPLYIPTEEDDVLDEIESLLIHLKALKEKSDGIKESHAPRKSNCTHANPKQVQRCKGNGFDLIWRCGDCGVYLKPDWVNVDSLGRPIQSETTRPTK